jgi:hypothetical protein
MKHFDVTTSYRVNSGIFGFTTAEAAVIDDTLVPNILKWCDAATTDQEAEGRVWYAYAQDLAKQITVSLRGKGFAIDFRTVAAVIAVTSNNMPWDRQIRVTEPVIEAILRHEDPKELHLGVMFSYLDKAARIIAGDMTALSGPKVSVFYLNIIGEHGSVTVDRHAVRVALDTYTDENTTNTWVKPESRARMLMEAAYYIAAQIKADEPATVQAIAWTVYRYSPEYKVGLEASKAAKRAAVKSGKVLIS